jgi:hypothetical protein
MARDICMLLTIRLKKNESFYKNSSLVKSIL